MGTSPARAVATDTLYRVAHQRAFASRVLDATLGRHGLSARDAALATEIVYGALRVLPALDALLRERMVREEARLDPLTRAALRVAAYQLRHLERVPAHAAVNDAVALVRAHRGPRLAAFANAVLRALASARPARPTRPSRTEVPKWLVQALRAGLSEQRLARLVRPATLPPPIGLRVDTSRTTRQQLAELVRRSKPRARLSPGACSERTLLAWSVGDPRALPGYEQGLFVAQEEGAQLVVELMDVRPGQSVADVCAGRGGKTTRVAELVGAQGSVTALDLHERKLQRLREEFERLGLKATLETLAVDLSLGSGGLGRRFDHVLVDAPCSGIGTLHRRPDVLLRLRPGDVPRLAALQLAILTHSAELVRPGGQLVFAVCSPLAGEGLEVAERFETQVPGVRRRFDSLRLSTLRTDADGVIRLGPWWGGRAGSQDAYQVVRWVVT